MSLESTPLTMIADKVGGQSFNIRSFYLGSAKPRDIARNMRFLTPINVSAVPRLFKQRHLPIHVALIQVSPPDDFGWMSLGVSVDITLAAAQSADLVIAQVNPCMPRIIGRSFVHVNDVDLIVEHEEPVLTVEEQPYVEQADMIGKLVARLIGDGSTIHLDPGAAPQSLLLALTGKRDLGIHTEYLTDGIMRLVAEGVITNRAKGYKEGKLVASGAIGSQGLYDFLDDNPAIDFQPSDYVNAPAIISRHKNMVSICVAESMDLTGQVAADALRYNHFSGVTGMLDFIRGAAQSENGKSILMLPATSNQGKTSRIVPMIGDIAVVVPRGDVHYVVTEYGMVSLFGKSLQERAMAMISIAHPDFRDELFQKAKERGLLSRSRTLSEAMYGSIYPAKIESTLVVAGETLTFRPAKPVDQRRIQEHFYNLEKSDVVSRFFHEKTCFLTKEIEEVSQIDYVKDLTVVALTGEVGFSSVVAVGEYLLEETQNLAEVAFSVSKRWQGHGLGRILIAKLAEAAHENGIEGLVAYTSPGNKGMISLFKTLPYKMTSSYDGGMVELKCTFSEPLD
ncbi:MAG: GNAT family N-acetyltransferase, partial [Desulfobacterales bacterium]|nr:GNAT family N-acetyltransferase [Desulfobacterales bacterium]